MMKPQLSLIALVLLSAFTSSLAAHSPLPSPQATYAFQSHVIPVKPYQISLVGPVSMAAVRPLLLPLPATSGTSPVNYALLKTGILTAVLLLQLSQVIQLHRDQETVGQGALAASAQAKAAGDDQNAGAPALAVLIVGSTASAQAKPAGEELDQTGWVTVPRAARETDVVVDYVVTSKELAAAKQAGGSDDQAEWVHIDSAQEVSSRVVARRAVFEQEILDQAAAAQVTLQQAAAMLALKTEAATLQVASDPAVLERVATIQAALAQAAAAQVPTIQTAIQEKESCVQIRALITDANQQLIALIAEANQLITFMPPIVPAPTIVSPVPFMPPIVPAPTIVSPGATYPVKPVTSRLAYWKSAFNENCEQGLDPARDCYSALAIPCFNKPLTVPEATTKHGQLLFMHMMTRVACLIIKIWF